MTMELMLSTVKVVLYLNEVLRKIHEKSRQVRRVVEEVEEDYCRQPVLW